MRHVYRQLRQGPEAAAPPRVAVHPGVIVQTERLPRTVEALGVVFGGLFAATSLIMFALGNDRAGYMLGVAGALSSAVVGAIKVYAQD